MSETRWYFRYRLSETGERERLAQPVGERVPAQVLPGAEGDPVGWMNRAGVWQVTRVWAHWIFEGNGVTGGDVAVYRVMAHAQDEDDVREYELVHDPGQAGDRPELSGWTVAAVLLT